MKHRILAALFVALLSLTPACGEVGEGEGLGGGDDQEQQEGGGEEGGEGGGEEQEGGGEEGGY